MPRLKSFLQKFNSFTQLNDPILIAIVYCSWLDALEMPIKCMTTNMKLIVRDE